MLQGGSGKSYGGSYPGLASDWKPTNGDGADSRGRVGTHSCFRGKFGWGEDSSIALKLELARAKTNKSSVDLGLHQKDTKKSASEKNSKVGRNKDLDKIKLMGENLVESGSVKNLDSHFSNPPK